MTDKHEVTDPTELEAFCREVGVALGVYSQSLWKLRGAIGTRPPKFIEAKLDEVHRVLDGLASDLLKSAVQASEAVTEEPQP